VLCTMQPKLHMGRELVSARVELPCAAVHAATVACGSPSRGLKLCVSIALVQGSTFNACVVLPARLQYTPLCRSLEVGASCCRNSTAPGKGRRGIPPVWAPSPVRYRR
jgi:hypothetical protein